MAIERGKSLNSISKRPGLSVIFLTHISGRKNTCLKDSGWISMRFPISAVQNNGLNYLTQATYLIERNSAFLKMIAGPI